MPRLIAALCALMLLAGCSSAPSSSAAPRRQPNPVASSSQPSSSEASSEAEEEACPLDIADIKLNLSVAPYRDNYYEIKASYTNGTPLTITYFSFDFLEKSTNNSRTLGTGSTVLSGENSPNFNLLIDSTSADDIVILKARIKALDEKDDEWNIEYDYKLDKYDWYMVES